jgi:hypothetical protein
MSMTNSGENSLLLLFFNNSNFANIGDATGLRGSSAAGNFYISLHTADPAEGGNQTSNEATYTGYARKAIARTAGAFVVTGSLAENVAAIAFDPCSGGANTVTHFGIGTDSSGVGNLIFKGILTASLDVSNGITPQFAAGDLNVTID